MPTVQELVDTYQEYSDIDLLHVNSQIDEYTKEAKEALKIVIEKRGGIDVIKERLSKEIEINNEASNIKKEVIELLKQGENTIDIKDKILINHISPAHLNKIIEDTKDEFDSDKKDREIRSGTVIGSIIGGLIGGTFGGVFLGLVLIYSNRIFVFLIVALAFISYGSIKIFTRQSKKNSVVLVATVASFIFAILLGELIYEIFGFRG